MNSAYWLSGCGGALGVMLRVLLGKYLPSQLLGLPTYILCINLMGCFVLGLIVEFFAFKSHFPVTWNYFLVAGFLGGFTTFSSYILELSLLLEKHEYFWAFVYWISSNLLGLLMFLLAVQVIRWILS